MGRNISLFLSNAIGYFKIRLGFQLSMKNFILLIALFYCQMTWSNELSAEQTRFQYMSTTGDIYTNCNVKKGTETHQFIVDCPEVKRWFSVHMLLNQYERKTDDAKETTYEFHYWVDEPDNGFRSNTQSTWLTVDSITDVLKIVSYVGLDNDANQLRVEIRF